MRTLTFEFTGRVHIDLDEVKFSDGLYVDDEFSSERLLEELKKGYMKISPSTIFQGEIDIENTRNFDILED